ncbi:unnamed protein product [Dibothriocephalus latus]|uniref:Fibronectin type-III domain-containing protein n=1 Tax=Dibothriocephalus latus TaxID=60516 RepID=A0A3P6R6A6_DIBLA|nr:unnamed protein product [Dibothriocephalus latus]
MEAPKGMVGTFKAIAWLWEEYPKGCTMVAKGDMLSCVIPQLLPNAPYTVAVETCKEENDCVLYSDCVDFVWTKPSGKT